MPLKGISHKNKVNEFEFLSNAEAILEKISNHFHLNFGDSSYTLHNIEQLSVEKSVLNNRTHWLYIVLWQSIKKGERNGSFNTKNINKRERIKGWRKK